MARYDLFVAGDTDTLLLELQSDLFESMETRVVAPLLPAAAAPASIARLHPVFTIQGRRYVLAIHLVATVPRATLDRPFGNLAAHGDRVSAALGMLFHGF